MSDKEFSNLVCIDLSMIATLASIQQMSYWIDARVANMLTMSPDSDDAAVSTSHVK